MRGAHFADSPNTGSDNGVAGEPIKGDGGQPTPKANPGKCETHGHQPTGFEILNMDVTEQLGQKQASDLFLAKKQRAQSRDFLR